MRTPKRARTINVGHDQAGLDEARKEAQVKGFESDHLALAGSVGSWPSAGAFLRVQVGSFEDYGGVGMCSATTAGRSIRRGIENSWRP